MAPRKVQFFMVILQFNKFTAPVSYSGSSMCIEKKLPYGRLVFHFGKIRKLKYNYVPLLKHSCMAASLEVYLDCTHGLWMGLTNVYLLIFPAHP
jgi:hypothetical protein